MQVIFTQSEIDKAASGVRRYKLIWLMSFLVYLVVIIGMFVIFTVQVEVFQDRTLKIPFMVISLVISLLFFGATIMVHDLKYRVIRARSRMFKEIKNGVKEKTSGTVVEIDKSLSQKDDVWFYSLILECAPIRRDQKNIRRLLIQKDRPAPPLEPGDRIEFVAHSGILVAYEKITPVNSNGENVKN